jgi:DNA-binding protein WhiA
MTGSVSDPSKSYHLEIVFQRQEDARMIVKLMDSLGFSARVSTRKGRYVVYLKESEQISDLLGAMGATLCLMKLENERILKDIAGNINRQVNFDAANLKKTGVTSKRQREDIEFIERTAGLGTLPATLQQAAYLRLQMPDASLQELSEASQPHVGKSGINHRLKRLESITQELRDREGRAGSLMDGKDGENS